jgi:magnesium transporter
MEGEERVQAAGQPGRGKRKRRTRNRPGTAPGIERVPEIHAPPDAGAVHLQCIDFGPDLYQARAIDDLATFLATERPRACAVRWINIDGLHPYVVERLRQHYGFHTLAAEDVLHVHQRPKLDPYGDHLFMICRMVQLRDGRLYDEQTSVFLFPDTVLTFQETSGDVWDPIRKRIENTGSRLRGGSAAYLVYALLDAVVDHGFPVLDHYAERLEAVEGSIVEQPAGAHLRELHEVKRQLISLRRVMWPMRQVADDLHRSEHPLIDKKVRNYLRDVYDHTIQVMEMCDTQREMAASLTDLYMSSISNRMNEVMKVLTIMASMFIPITFLAGVYGMNFVHFPELGWKYAYPVFWIVCVAVTAGLVVYFRRKGWIGD